MQDSTILKLALITSIIGVVSLFFVLQFSKGIELSSFSQLEETLEEEQVVVKGKVVSVSQKNGVSFIKVSKVEELDLVIFDNVDLNVGSEILAQGLVSKYAGEKNIVVDKISIV